MKFLLATANSGKIREFRNILKGMPIDIVSLRQFKDMEIAEETGKSFTANARIKAISYHRQTELLTMAEDSGLQVDALNGRPGYLSSRFSGKDASDSENIRKVLRLMRGITADKRAARFVSVIAITDGKKMWIATGKCEGRIASRALGDSGFGYDPVFIPKGYKSTFARLGTQKKNQISHRAQALQKARHILERILAENAQSQ